MNYKLIKALGKKFDIKAAYRQYDYNNNTPVLSFTPVQGDIAPANVDEPEENTPFGYNKKNMEVTGNWYFAKKSSLKSRLRRRDHGPLPPGCRACHGKWVCHRRRHGSAQGSFFPRLLSLFGRNPEHYLDDQSLEIAGGITADQTFSRRFDEAARTRNRGDAEDDQYSPTDRLSFSGFGGTDTGRLQPARRGKQCFSPELHGRYHQSLLPVRRTERSFLQRRIRRRFRADQFRLVVCGILLRALLQVHGIPLPGAGWGIRQYPWIAALRDKAATAPTTTGEVLPATTSTSLPSAGISTSARKRFQHLLFPVRGQGQCGQPSIWRPYHH